MSGNSLLLDTNAVIALLDGNEIVAELCHEGHLFVSFITELEIQSYQKLTSVETKIIKQFLGDCIIIDLSPEIKKKTIEFRSKYKIHLPDALIAATAFNLDIPLVSADRVFEKVGELNLFKFRV
jgi:predicted nucleic acid-binding protein